MAKSKKEGGRPSRSQKRKVAEEVQKLGERLLELTEERIKELELPEDLEEAVLFAKTIDSRAALKRQKQFIGKLMRKIDPEPIEAFFKKIDDRQKAVARSFHRLEKWRDRLVAGDEKIVGEILGKYPDCDGELLRSLSKQAQREKEAGKTPRAARKLFKFLRQLVETLGGTLAE